MKLTTGVKVAAAAAASATLFFAAPAMAADGSFHLQLNDQNPGVHSLLVNNSVHGGSCFSQPRSGGFPTLFSGDITVTGYGSTNCSGGQLGNARLKFNAPSGVSCMITMTTKAITTDAPCRKVS